jgi:dienelactone hydrolase
MIRADRPLFGADHPSPEEIDRRLRTVLGVLPQPPEPGVSEHARWSRDGVEGVELSWETGFGPRTSGWLLRPAGETAPLPGVLALHCHGNMKFFGKEKIADGPSAEVPGPVAAFRAQCYSGRAYADEIARAGFAVLAHDAFGWGSRRFPVADMPLRSERLAALDLDAARRAGTNLTESETYDLHAGPFEDAMAKNLGVLGTSWAGLIAREDLLALGVLAARPETRGAPAAVGFSGGGARAAILSALSDRVGATVVIGMMSTLADLVDSHLHQHSWTLMSPGLGTVADLPNIAAARAPRPLFVGYGTADPLFPLAGMRAAHDALTEHYAGTNAYRGVFRDAPHAFDGTLQAEVIRFLRDALPRQRPVPTTADTAAGRATGPPD